MVLLLGADAVSSNILHRHAPLRSPLIHPLPRFEFEEEPTIQVYFSLIVNFSKPPRSLSVNFQIHVRTLSQQRKEGGG